MSDDRPLVYAIRMTERAVRDIEAALVQLAARTEEHIAVDWFTHIYGQIATLANYPRRQPIAREEFKREVRQMLVRRPGGIATHRVLFTIYDDQGDGPEGPTVKVLHVRHASARPISRKEARQIEADS